MILIGSLVALPFTTEGKADDATPKGHGGAHQGSHCSDDQGVFEVRLVGQALKDALEHAAAHPTAEALKDAVPVAELAREVAPGQASANAQQHRLQE